MPRPNQAPDKKFSLRNLRARFKNASTNAEEAIHTHAPKLEKLHVQHSNSDSFNPWDLANPEPNSAGFPYSPSWSPGSSVQSPYFTSPQEKVLPTVPQIPQIQVTQIVATIPRAPTPPPVLPVVQVTSYEEQVSDLPYVPESQIQTMIKAVEDIATSDSPDAEGRMVVLAEGSTVVDEASSDVLRAVPRTELLDAHEMVYKMKRGINDLPTEIPSLLGVLDDVARIHPSISVVILAFKAAYNMERTRRDNDRRVSMLYVAMKDMLSVLIQLRDVRDPAHIGPEGLIHPRLESVSSQAAQDIKNCANVCETYVKKTLVVRVLRSQVWEERLTAFFGVFAQRRRDFEFALAIHTAGTVDTVAESVDEMNKTISELTALVREIYNREWTPTSEQQLARKIEEKGGMKFVENNDTALSELANIGNEEYKGGSIAKLQGRTVKGSTLTLQDLKDELFEDWESAVRRNMETFEGKFALYQRQLQEELSKTMQDNTSRIIDELNRGPHDKIKNGELRAIWKEMDWKLNVKARLFVMTLRDHYKERAESAAISSFGSSQQSDDWAFEFINAKYLQPIMEAFDDDGSGYVTYQEVNEFVEERPASLRWSLPHWVAYWAVGWQITAGKYRDQIVALLNRMFSLRSSIKAENRYWIDYYLRSVWPVAFELTQSLRSANIAEHIEDKFQAFADYEEERIRKNLQDIHFDIDALDTVYVVAGPGRIEKYLFPLMYLLLKRDLAILNVAKTKILHKEELLDAADSLLWVLKAVNYRYLDLSVLFKQNHLNVDNQMKVIACGLFDYLHNSASLWTWRTLQDLDETQSPEFDEDIESPDPDQVLNYPPQDEHSFKCSLYDSPVHQDTCDNVRTSDAMRALLGEWNGFVYSASQYPMQLMTSFRVVPDQSDHRTFRASGIHDSVSFEVLGRCRLSQSQRGRINVAFVIRYAREYSAQYFNGYLDADSSLVGTEGWDQDPANHTAKFIFKRVPARLVCQRPSPMEFQVSRAKAHWKFATRAVLHEVRRWFWTWSYFRQRREVRLRYIELSTRFSAYGHKPNEQELIEWMEHRRRVIAVDASFYRILRDERLKIVPAHDCYCNGCNGKIGGARVVCLDCLSGESEAKTVDFCENPECWKATPNTDSGSHRHLPTHDIFKVRTVLHLRDIPSMNEMAEKALNVSREYFQSSSSDNSEQGGDSRGQDVDDTLAPYYEDSGRSNVKCRICNVAVQQPCWFCIDCFTSEEQVYICDDCESKTLLQCIRCSRTYKQPAWYYGTHQSDNFMCNTCNWRRAEPPSIGRHKQHTYLHALVRCTPKAEGVAEQAELTTDERMGVLEKGVGALDGRMSRLEEALVRIERLLVANLAASTNMPRAPPPQPTPNLCERCREPVVPQLPPLSL